MADEEISKRDKLQRPLKFRGYNIDTKNMEFLNGWSLEHWFLDIGTHIMQFTWLIDKNHHEIYEWDIVKIDWINWYGIKKSENREVLFHEGIFCIHNDYEYIPLRDFCHIKNPHQQERNDCEIIGNIYEND